MDPLLVHPADPPAELVGALRAAGYPFLTCDDADTLDDAATWTGAVVAVTHDREAAWAFCRSLRRRAPLAPLAPLVLVVDPDGIDELDLREDLFDDFVAVADLGTQLHARLRHLFWRTGRGDPQPELVTYAGIELDVTTYQVRVDGTAVDLTFTEYELLKFFMTRPGKTFSRETLLNRVWGHEYYGGLRTVDVHVRRLRAKLGEAHDHVTTVRSVGYRFGESTPVIDLRDRRRAEPTVAAGAAATGIAAGRI